MRSTRVILVTRRVTRRVESRPIHRAELLAAPHVNRFQRISETEDLANRMLSTTALQKT